MATFKRTSTTRRELNTNNLFAPALAIKGIDELTVATEQQLHIFLHVWVDDTVQAVRNSIEAYNVIETGATLASVYGVYPLERSYASKVRNDPKMQYDSVSVKTLTSYQAARTNARELRRSLQNESSAVHVETGRPKFKGDAAQLNHGARDTPFTPIGRVKRGNLYAGVGVATWYAWFPHEGYGQQPGEGSGRGSGHFHEPRRFFKEPVLAQQARLVKAMQTGLETTVRGRLKQRANVGTGSATRSAVRSAYDNS